MHDWRPDWRKEASRKLANTKFSAAEREEVSRELAGHLEDLCSDACSKGLGESSTADRAFAELNEDARLGPNLRRAREENPMNDRTKQLWLPGLTMLLATMALLRISQLSALHPYYGVLFLRLSASHPTPYWHVAMYNPWLCVLPFLGAAGAYWARRAGSGRAIQSAVGLFPLLVFVASFLAIRHFRLAEVLTLKWAAVDMLNGIAIPGVALLLGILPFLRRSSAHRRMV